MSEMCEDVNIHNVIFTLKFRKNLLLLAIIDKLSFLKKVNKKEEYSCHCIKYFSTKKKIKTKHTHTHKARLDVW